LVRVLAHEFAVKRNLTLPRSTPAQEIQPFQHIDFLEHTVYLPLQSRFLQPVSMNMTGVSSKSVSQLLVKWKQGDEEALRALVPLVYAELRRLAHYYLRGENPGHTLESTALVHEAYLRLAERSPLQLQNRAHFFAVASHLMRQILVDYARRRRRAKRGGGRKLTFDEAVFLSRGRDLDLVALDGALNQLSRLDTQQSKIVELRFFCGLSIAQTADILSISPATVKRDWATARIWLHREMSRSAQR
jgi:RNA polymerase sigma factor (TIGR02999 family)